MKRVSCPDILIVPDNDVVYHETILIYKSVPTQGYLEYRDGQLIQIYSNIIVIDSTIPQKTVKMLPTDSGDQSHDQRKMVTVQS